MIPFRERNPVTIGAAGLVTLALLVAAAFNIESLPLIGSGEKYSAAFSEASGLKPGDKVSIAGVDVGEVDAVELDGGHVKVTFHVEDGPEFGTRTGASIRVKTILGAKYLALHPKGPGQLEPEEEIPLGRTVSAYDVVEAFSDLTTTTEQIDTGRLSEAMDTISTTFEDSPQEVKAAIKGLSRLSKTVASRDRSLRKLLERADGVSGVLADRSKEFIKLVEDGGKLFEALSKRRQAIHALLVNSTALSVQLSGLVDDNREQIGPALNRLDQVVDMLERNEKSLNRSIKLLAPFARVFTNTLGNGRWFDSYIQNIVAVPGSPRTSSHPSSHTPSHTSSGGTR